MRKVAQPKKPTTKVVKSLLPESKNFFTLGGQSINEIPTTRKLHDETVSCLMNEGDITSQDVINAFHNSIVWKIEPTSRATADQQGLVVVAKDDEAKNHDNGIETRYTRVPKVSQLPIVKPGEGVQISVSPNTDRSEYIVNLDRDYLNTVILTQIKNSSTYSVLQTLLQEVDKLKAEILQLKSINSAVNGDYLIDGYAALKINNGLITKIKC